jgi:hypothetical protein
MVSWQSNANNRRNSQIERQGLLTEGGKRLLRKALKEKELMSICIVPVIHAFPKGCYRAQCGPNYVAINIKSALVP